jgi:hypothetical protein
MPVGAIKADLAQHSPHNSYSPPMWYVDENRKCVDCRLDFTFGAQEQQYWYEFLHIPIFVQVNQCRACRKKRRDQPKESPQPFSGDPAGSDPGNDC